jgi:hypothetical protein
MAKTKPPKPDPPKPPPASEHVNTTSRSEIMVILNARKFSDGSYSLRADGVEGGDEKSFGDLESLQSWANGPADNGWEPLQIALVDRFKQNPAWDDVQNLVGTTLTLIKNVVETKVV